MRPTALLVASALTTACAPAPPRHVPPLPSPASFPPTPPRSPAPSSASTRAHGGPPPRHVLPSRGEDPIRLGLETERGFRPHRARAGRGRRGRDRRRGGGVCAAPRDLVVAALGRGRRGSGSSSSRARRTVGSPSPCGRSPEDPRGRPPRVWRSPTRRVWPGSASRRRRRTRPPGAPSTPGSRRGFWRARRAFRRRRPTQASTCSIDPTWTPTTAMSTAPAAPSRGALARREGAGRRRLQHRGRGDRRGLRAGHAHVLPHREHGDHAANSVRRAPRLRPGAGGGETGSTAPSATISPPGPGPGCGRHARRRREPSRRACSCQTERCCSSAATASLRRPAPISTIPRPTPGPPRRYAAHRPRRSHGATLLLDGTVLVAGGVTSPLGHDAITATAEIYRSGGRRLDWPTPPPRARGHGAGHTATPLADGRVLVAGGTATPGASTHAQRARDEPGLRSGVGPVDARPADEPAARGAPGDAAPQRRAVLVTGGLDGSGSAESAAELFDPGSAGAPPPWIAVAPMTRDRILHTATELGDGTVLVAGGEQQSSAELFEIGVPSEACAGDPQCASGHCADAVCCATACDGPCHTCASPGAPGTCVPAGAGHRSARRLRRRRRLHDPTCGTGSTCTSREGTLCTAGGCTADGEGRFAAAVCTAGLPGLPGHPRGLRRGLPLRRRRRRVPDRLPHDRRLRDRLRLRPLAPLHPADQRRTADSRADLPPTARRPGSPSPRAPSARRRSSPCSPSSTAARSRT